MRQFYEAYRDNAIVSPLVRQLPWTHHLIIMGQCKRAKEREFYIRLAIREKWGKRELERRIGAALFERAVLNPPKVSSLMAQIHPEAVNIFKDAYSLELLGIPDDHSESDLHGALLRNLGRFITELGRDFCFVGSEFPIQVGGQDFALDLLFFHRGLNCLVAIELKAARFEPEHLGKLNFYLEAIDRDVRKPHENPSIGLLLLRLPRTRPSLALPPHGLRQGDPGVEPLFERLGGKGRLLSGGREVGRQTAVGALASHVGDVQIAQGVFPSLVQSGGLGDAGNPAGAVFAESRNLYDQVDGRGHLGPGDVDG